MRSNQCCGLTQGEAWRSVASKFWRAKSLKDRMAFCAACGNSIPEGERFCRVCGRDSAQDGAPATIATTPYATPVPTAPGATSGKAIGSLVCGLLFFFFPASIVAVVLGHIALSEIKKSGGRIGGQGLAIAGLVLGYAGIVFIPFILIIAAIAIPNLLHARMAANEASAVSNVRMLGTAEISYASNHPDEGFTCSFTDLSRENLIAGELASGRKTGYTFELANCSAEPTGGANTKFQVVAYPQSPNQSGRRAFCSDESQVIKVDAGGSAQNCLENGTLLSQ